MKDDKQQQQQQQQHRLSRELYFKNFRSSSFIKNPNQAPHYDPYKTQYRFDCFPTGALQLGEDSLTKLSSESLDRTINLLTSRPKYTLPDTQGYDSSEPIERSQFSILERIDKQIFKRQLDQQVAQKQLNKLIQEKESKAYELAMVKKYPFGKSTYEKFKYSNYIPDFTSQRSQESPRSESKQLEFSRWNDWPSKPGAGVLTKDHLNNHNKSKDTQDTIPDSPRTSIATVSSLKGRQSDAFNGITQQRMYTKGTTRSNHRNSYDNSSSDIF